MDEVVGATFFQAKVDAAILRFCKGGREIGGGGRPPRKSATVSVQQLHGGLPRTGQKQFVAYEVHLENGIKALRLVRSDKSLCGVRKRLEAPRASHWRGRLLRRLRLGA